MVQNQRRKSLSFKRDLDILAVFLEEVRKEHGNVVLFYLQTTLLEVLQLTVSTPNSPIFTVSRNAKSHFDTLLYFTLLYY